MNQSTALARVEALQAALRTTIIPPQARAQLDQLQQELQSAGGTGTTPAAEDPALARAQTTLALVMYGHLPGGAEWGAENDLALADAVNLADKLGIQYSPNTEPFTINGTEHRLPKEVVDFIHSHGEYANAAHEQVAALQLELEQARLLSDPSQAAAFAGLLSGWAGLVEVEAPLPDPVEAAATMRKLASLLVPAMYAYPVGQGEDEGLEAAIVLHEDGRKEVAMVPKEHPADGTLSPAITGDDTGITAANIDTSTQQPTE